MKRLPLFALALALSLPVYAQEECAPEPCITRDYAFLEYLLGNSLDLDASTLLAHTPYAPSDTLDFVKAWTEYSLQQLESASQHFLLIPGESPFYDKATFFGAVCNAHLGNYSQSEAILDAWFPKRYDSCPTLLKDCYALERSGLALLDGRVSEYHQWAALNSGTSSALGDAFGSLETIYSELYFRKTPKPLTAALLSAVFPGAGKLYAGDTVGAALAFLLEGAFAAIVLEQSKHYGPKDYRTLAWAGAALTIHAINIYGATVSVSIKNEEFSQKRTAAVLYNIHIPLRQVFR